MRRQQAIRRVTEITTRQLSACQLYTDYVDIVYELALYALESKPRLINLQIKDKSLMRLSFDRVCQLEEILNLFVRCKTVESSEEWSRLAYLKEVCSLEIKIPETTNSEASMVLDAVSGQVERSPNPITRTVMTVKNIFKTFPVR